MSFEEPTPPFSLDLDVAALSRLFSNTTNSYKFLFFLSLLDILKRNKFEPGLEIHFRDITIEMLANSWYPHTYFRLSFGLQDKITEKLDSFNLEISTPILKFKDPEKKLLRETISNQLLDDSLMRYVPYRTLRPFFEQEVRGIPDNRVDAAIGNLANQYFFDRKPLYRFGEGRNSIIFHSSWVEYIKLHYSIVRAWVAWNWLGYMQKCNQAVPAVSSKLFPPQERDALKKQTEYWKLVAERSEIKCIYSGNLLSPSMFSLDHYLPWSFVAHDLLWNLIPTLAEVNSSKSDRLPANIYFQRFVALQCQGLRVSSEYFERPKWEKYTEPFIADLKIVDRADLLDVDRLNRAYDLNVKPLVELAKSCGFSADWRFQAFSE